MLCDSVGIMPAPNNGTLRLPLKPIGLHSGNHLETPADPAVHTLASSSAASSTKSLAPTKPIMVNPVTTTATSATPTVTVTKTVEKTVGADKPTPQPTEKPSDEDNNVGDSVKNFWEWFTGKVSNWWDKVTSTSGESESDDPPSEGDDFSD